MNHGVDCNSYDQRDNHFSYRKFQENDHDDPIIYKIIIIIINNLLFETKNYPYCQIFIVMK